MTERSASLSLTLTLGTLSAFGPLSIDMYLPSLPAIQAELHTTPAAVQLSLATFMVGMGAGQLLYGPISDRLGRRRPLAWGISLYVLASLGCALATRIEALIALRFMQALGGAAGPVIARAVVRDLYSGRDIARQLSVMTLVMGAAPILAPVLGSAVLAASGWRAIFWTLSSIGVAAGALAWWMIPHTAQPKSSTGMRVNLITLLRDPAFMLATALGAFAQSSLFAYIACAPFVFMGQRHASPREFALVFGVNAAGFIGAAQLNRWLLARFSASGIAGATALVLCLVHALLLRSVFGAAWHTNVFVVALFGSVALLGLILPNAAAIALERHAAIAGLASSLLGAIQFGAGAFTAALVGERGASARAMASAMATGAGLALTMAVLLRQRERRQLRAAS